MGGVGKTDRSSLARIDQQAVIIEREACLSPVEYQGISSERVKSVPAWKKQWKLVRQTGLPFGISTETNRWTCSRRFVGFD